MKRLLGLAGLAAIVMGTGASAEDGFPKFTADFSVELESDYTFSSTDPAAELIDTYATIGAGLSLEFETGTSLNASLVFEPVLDPVDDRFFEDHGLYVEELFLQQEVEGVVFKLGKFNPLFGAAWDLAPGIYGSGFAEDYELTERIGGEIALPFDAMGAEHELTVAVFAADTTALSESVFQDRGLTRSGSGGVSNTRSPESFAFSLAGAFGDTGYNLGLQYQSKGTGDTHDQSGVVFGLTQAVPIGDDAAMELLAEAAYFPHFDGAEESALIGTIGAAAPIGPVTLSGVYAVRDVEAADTDHLATTTVDFEIYDGVSAGIGYRFGREGGESSHTVGFLIGYEFGVSYP